MRLKCVEASFTGILITVEDNGDEIGRCRLYLMENSDHDKPLGYIEDVYVHPDHRKKGIGVRVVRKAVELAKKKGCYKLVLTARDSKPWLHRWYEKLGFTSHGRSFRIDFK